MHFESPVINQKPLDILLTEMRDHFSLSANQFSTWYRLLELSPYVLVLETKKMDQYTPKKL